MKKITIMFLLILMVSFCLTACYNQPTNNDYSFEDFSTSEQPIEETTEALSEYEPPANFVEIDFDVDDPSNEDIQFTYNEQGLISECEYKVDDNDVKLKYTYIDNSIQIYGYIDSLVVVDICFEEIVYNVNIGFCEHDGYYFKGVDFENSQESDNSDTNNAQSEIESKVNENTQFTPYSNVPDLYSSGETVTLSESDMENINILLNTQCAGVYNNRDTGMKVYSCMAFIDGKYKDYDVPSGYGYKCKEEDIKNCSIDFFAEEISLPYNTLENYEVISYDNGYFYVKSTSLFNYTFPREIKVSKLSDSFYKAEGKLINFAEQDKQVIVGSFNAIIVKNSDASLDWQLLSYESVAAI